MKPKKAARKRTPRHHRPVNHATTCAILVHKPCDCGAETAPVIDLMAALTAALKKQRKP